MRRGRVQTGPKPAERRWNLEQRERIERALRWFAGRCGSYWAADVALGVSKNTTGRMLSTGITEGFAEKLAAHLGVDIDDIASGRWKPEGAAA